MRPIIASGRGAPLGLGESPWAARSEPVSALREEADMRLRFLGASLLASMVGLAFSPAAWAGTVARWHMDETSGTIMHDSAGGHDGAIHNVLLGTPGFIHTAYQFAGNSWATVPSAAALNPGTAKFTMIAHVKLTRRPTSGDYDIIKKGSYSAPGGEYKMEILQSGQALCGFQGSLRYAEISGGPNLATGQWYTITCTKTDTTVSLSVAGKTLTNARAVGSISNTSAVGIGAAPGSDFYRGILDEVSLTTG
jgi:hypothetical protein